MSNTSAVKTTPIKDNKAEKLSAAIAQVFKGHTAKLGSKTLTSIAFCTRSKE